WHKVFPSHVSSAPAPQNAASPPSVAVHDPPATSALTGPAKKKPVKTKGNGNTSGNDVRGNSNTVGNSNVVGINGQVNQAPVNIGPGSIGITGGTVTNPTVNNFGPLPPPVPTVKICATPS